MSQIGGTTHTPTVLTDDVLRNAIDGTQAVRWMREAVIAADVGSLHAPARSRIDVGPGPLIFTAGSLSGEWFGYRSYDALHLAHEDQVVVLHSAVTGRLQAIAVGDALGEIRTGALGGLAADILSRSEAASLGVIGSGPQAWTQIWAVSAVRPVAKVDIFSLDPPVAEALARRVRSELDLACDAVSCAEAAVRDHDVIVLATTSPAPVLDAAWVAPGTHITTLGPKHQGRSEIGMDLLELADVVSTDSCDQLAAYVPPALALASPHADVIQPLGAVAAGRAPGRTGVDQVSVYLSTGLAGSEVHLLYRAVQEFGWVSAATD